MLKHVGKHKEKKIVVVFRKVPGEDHMCLVAYSHLLPDQLHADVMSCVEGHGAQAESELATALGRVQGGDGNNLLNSLHQGGYLAKVQAETVTMTPTASASIQLDEMNRIIDDIERGEAASKQMAESQAVADEAGAIVKEAALEGKPDAEVAKQLLDQAKKFATEAKALEKQAYELDPALKPKRGRPGPKPKNKA